MGVENFDFTSKIHKGRIIMCQGVKDTPHFFFKTYFRICLYINIFLTHFITNFKLYL
jgi:hypothetical protein